MAIELERRRPLGPKRWWLAVLGGAGMLMHLGTALLRLGTFFPHPQSVDFAGYYAAAWAVRLGLPVYPKSYALLHQLRTTQGLSFQPGAMISFPLWPVLLQPLTVFRFPVAAWIWLLILLGLSAWSACALAQVAARDGWKQRGLIVLLVLTFGPVFLTLTLGQNSVFMLVAALVIGRALRRPPAGFHVGAVLAWGVAVAAKPLPVLWLGALPLLRRWRPLVLAMDGVLVVGGALSVSRLSESQERWIRGLPQLAASLSGSRTGLDDQSLIAWVERLGLLHTYKMTTLSIDRTANVTWPPVWPVDARFLRWAAYAIAAGSAVLCALVLLWAAPSQAEGAFYLWVLFSLLPLPHVERYNHVLLLPAMAWLWARGPAGQSVAVAGYFLAGLSRLNHVWALLFPVPWGPLAAGFGLYAVWLLAGGMIVHLRRSVQPDGGVATEAFGN